MSFLLFIYNQSQSQIEPQANIHISENASPTIPQTKPAIDMPLTYPLLYPAFLTTAPNTNPHIPSIKAKMPVARKTSESIPQDIEAIAKPFAAPRERPDDGCL